MEAACEGSTETPIPRIGDSIVVLHWKLALLAEVVRRGQSIAVVTNYAAAPIRERSAVKTAEENMPLLEQEAWNLYVEGKYPFPEIDWTTHRDEAPTSPKPNRTACRRAEAINLLYRVDKADAGHAVWFAKNLPFHLPLVKAMARVIGAQRNLVGGQGTLNATELADLQSINKILSVSGQILEKEDRGLLSLEIEASLRVLAATRSRLRALLGGLESKLKNSQEF